MHKYEPRSATGQDNWATPAINGSASIPGPGGPPLLGWQMQLLRLLRDPMMGMLKLQRQYGDIVALGRSASAPVLIFSPENVRQLLTDTELFYSFDANSSSALIKMPSDTAAARLLSGVAGMNGSTHTQHRRMLLPAFHRQYVDALRDSLVACIENHVAGWQAGQRRDLVHDMVELSLSMAVSGLLGLSPENEGKRVYTLLQDWGTSALSIPVHLLPIKLPGLPYSHFLRLSERLETELKEVLKRKQAQVETGSDPAGGDALSILLAVYGTDDAMHNADANSHSGTLNLTETQLLGHVATLFSSGHETTASALTWTFFLLAQHPQVLADLIDELEGKLHGATPTLAQLHELPLLDHVINESLRLFPPGMWMVRTSTRPFEIGSYRLPAQSRLIYSPAMIHRRAELYPDPHRFLPHRWETITPSPYEYLPFGAGPRRCLGATFAMLELRLVISLIVQRYRLAVPDGTRVERGGTVLSLPRGGLPVIIHSQDRKFRAGYLRGNISDLLISPAAGNEL